MPIAPNLWTNWHRRFRSFGECHGGHGDDEFDVVGNEDAVGGQVIGQVIGVDDK